MNDAGKGAFTRKISAPMLKDTGAQFVIWVIQSGGSAHPNDAKDFMEQPDADGLLVGRFNRNRIV